MTQDTTRSRKTAVWITGGIAVALFLFNSVLAVRIESIKKQAARNQKELGDIMPGLSEDSVEALREDIQTSQEKLLYYAMLFDPKDTWLKKDYDLSIYFAQELGNTTQGLKAQAARKQVPFVDLGFTDTLPQEEEAAHLLTRLFGLRELLGTGMDYGIQFKSVSHVEVEQDQSPAGIKVLKSRVEFSCPAQSLLEFIISLNTLIPRPAVESFSIKSQDTSYEARMTIDNLSITHQTDKEISVKDFEAFQETITYPYQEYVRLLRANNPFFVPAPEQPEINIETPALTQPAKPRARFIFKGNAILQSKKIAVIEDVLDQETFFLNKGESIGGHVLIDFTSDYAVLRSREGEELTINREE